MTLKTKLLATISMVAVTIALLMVGVWAVKTANFSVGGNISFTASGINATISAGTLNDASAWKTASDADEKLKEIVMNTDKTQSQIESEFASWSGLDFVFNEAGEDVTITFTITNTSTKVNDYIGISIVADAGEAVNATVSANLTYIPLAPSQSKQIVLTFSVTDKTANASLTGFNIEFLMEQETPVDGSYASTGLSFETNDTNMTAKIVGSNSDITSFIIPELIILNSKVYSVNEIGYYINFEEDGIPYPYFYNPTYIFVPRSVSVLEYAFDNLNLNGFTLEFERGISIVDDLGGVYGNVTVILPDTVKEFDVYMHGSNNTFVFKSATPPQVSTNILSNMNSVCSSIQVPASSVEAYKTAWPDLASKISAISE